jgi:hypothetical protein
MRVTLDTYFAPNKTISELHGCMVPPKDMVDIV